MNERALGARANLNLTVILQLHILPLMLAGWDNPPVTDFFFETGLRNYVFAQQKIGCTKSICVHTF